MARIETRQFGSKRQVLLFPNKRELKAVQKALGKNSHDRVQGEVKYADDWLEYYIVLTGK